MLTNSDLKKISEIVNTSVGASTKLLDKRFTELFNYLDRDLSSLQRRVDRVEKVLKLPDLS